MGNCDGTFKSAVSYSVGSYPVRVAVSDFNGDGTFQPAMRYNTAYNVADITAVDLQFLYCSVLQSLDRQ
ncbi:VCBS repeat containing protein [Hyalomma marginatum]|uniref:VCBS repeat containing protein n=1 Tax=Hyalomma marginatum TaxID=34627 RepID=A0A8S4BWH1_9ACAR|nr:VCBS repeat containing protein [Hyalomma marginatum]CAG7599530.1 VCBS repeat containing protein [Hyalomma marginatum]